MLYTTSTSPYVVRVFLNTETDYLSGYRPGQPICTADDLVITVPAATAHEAARQAVAIGNRQGADMLGNAWPSDVRSVSVGDVLRVRDLHDEVVTLSVERFGFFHLNAPIADALYDDVVELAGQEKVSSR